MWSGWYCHTLISLCFNYLYSSISEQVKQQRQVLEQTEQAKQMYGNTLLGILQHETIVWDAFNAFDHDQSDQFKLKQMMREELCLTSNKQCKQWN